MSRTDRLQTMIRDKANERRHTARPIRKVDPRRSRRQTRQALSALAEVQP